MTYEEFVDVVKSLGCKPGFMRKGSYMAIHSEFVEGETVKGVGEFIDSESAGVIVVTDKFFYSKKPKGLLGVDSKTISLEKISSFSISGGFGKNLIITEGTSKYIYKTVVNYESIISAIKAGKEGNTTPEMKQTGEVDIAAELRKFKAMVDEGLITQEDFEKKKAVLLGL
jgi:hypothetical protein